MAKIPKLCEELIEDAKAIKNLAGDGMYEYAERFLHDLEETRIKLREELKKVQKTDQY